MNKCIYPNCNKDAPMTWYCRYHYLEKEMVYGVYDIRTLNKGFIWWGIKRIFNFYKYIVMRV